MPKLTKMPEKPSAHEQFTEWIKYKRSIDFYFDLLEDEGISAKKKHQLLYLSGGSVIQRSLENFEFPEDVEDKTAYDKMIEHMDKHFKTGVDNLAFLKQLLNMKQKESEPFADFAQRLKTQANLCDLGSARDNLLKTQIQKGAKNAKLFASADSWVNKSLDDIIGYGIADESCSPVGLTKVKVESKGESDEDQVGFVDSNRRDYRSQQYPRRPDTFRPQGRYGQQSGPSRNYGRGISRNYQQRSYPYSSGRGGKQSGDSQMRCFNCHKLGHRARECKSRNVFSINNDNGKVQSETFE